MTDNSTPADTPACTPQELPPHIAQVVERITDGFVMIDSADRYLYLNAQGERLLRTSRKELLGRALRPGSPFEAVVRDAREAVQPVTRREFAPGLGLWIECKAYTAPEGVFCYFRDITSEQQAAERTSRLLALTTALASAITVDDVASVIVVQAMPAFGASACRAYIIDEAGSMLKLLGSEGYDDETVVQRCDIPVDASLPFTDAVRKREPVFVSDDNERRERYPALADVAPHGRSGALAAVPMLLSDRAIGVIALRFSVDREFGVDDREYMLTLAGQCALALERARLYDSEHRLREDEHLHYLRSSRIEQALILSEERFRFAIEAADIGIWHRNFITGEHVWSERTRHLTATPDDAKLSYDFFISLLHPDDRDRVDAAFRRAIATRSTYEQEYRVVWPDDSVHWLYAKGRGYYDSGGEPIRYEGIVQGIDERKSIEAALSDSELNLRLALQSGRLGSWHLDLVGNRFLHVSDACKANFGLPAEAAFDYADLLAAIHPDDRVRVRAVIDGALRNGVDYHAEYRCLWPDASVHWIFAHGHPLFDVAGRATRIIGVTQDITDQKRTEAELAALYAREHRIAATLQRSLVMMPRPDDLGIDAASLYEPASDEADVGGDFMDAFTLPGGRVVLVVGDVVGKGLKAASRTAEIKYTLRAFLHLDPDPSTAVGMLNTFLCRPTDSGDSDLLAALALAIVDPSTGRVDVTLAGLEPPLIVRADGTPVEFDARGLPLGVTDDTVYDTATEIIAEGDLLVIASDGITEARSGDKFLGYDGLIRLAVSADRRGLLTPAALGILDGAKSFAGGTLHDDACLLLARLWPRECD